MTKENKNKEFLRNKETINIKEFMLQKSGEQDKLITDTLDKIYEGNVEVTKKHLEKVLNVAFDNKDNETYLPHSLCVKKDGTIGKNWFYAVGEYRAWVNGDGSTGIPGPYLDNASGAATTEVRLYCRIDNLNNRYKIFKLLKTGIIKTKELKEI